ncbi:MAG: hypothetical protein QXH57_02715 [Sulfolobales archaeon]
MSENELVLELIEEYIIDGERRFKLKIKGTNLVFNVSGSNLEEAVRKATSMIKYLKIR